MGFNSTNFELNLAEKNFFVLLFQKFVQKNKKEIIIIFDKKLHGKESKKTVCATRSLCSRCFYNEGI